MDQIDKIPLFGHIKCLAHLARGDDAKAEQAFVSANRSSMVIGGSIAGGSGGAALAGATADVMHSAFTGRNVGVVRDVKDIARSTDKGQVPWEGAGNLAARTGVDALCGKGIERRIVRQTMRQFRY